LIRSWKPCVPIWCWCDVNSTLAAAITATKRGIPVAHVEAGLRSFDRSMPEEINRILTDAVADFLFVTEESGRVNLVKEGVDPARIHFVGNVMIDALQSSRRRWENSSILHTLGVEPGSTYAVLALHRPSNVDDPGTLTNFLRRSRRWPATSRSFFRSIRGSNSNSSGKGTAATPRQIRGISSEARGLSTSSLLATSISSLS